MLALDWAYVSSTGILIVTGTSKDDRISISANDTEVFAKLGKSVAEFGIESVSRIRINAGQGDDDITNFTRFRATIDGSGGDDAIYGARSSEVLNGGQGDDSLFGGGGDDTLAGGGGDDNLQAGQGDDLLLVESNNDVLVGGAGLRDVVDFSLSVARVNIGPTFDNSSNELMYAIGSASLPPGRIHTESIEVIRATEHDDLLYLTDSTTIPIRGLEIECGAGKDDVYFDARPLTIFGQAGNDRVLPRTIRSGLASIEAFGGPGHDLIFASASPDTIDGGSGNDTIWSDYGKDVLIGGQGDDQFFDLAGGDRDRDTIDGGAGNDLVRYYRSDVPNLLRGIETAKDELMPF